MSVKIFAAIVAIVMVGGFLLPYVLKMKEVPLGVVILAGIAMMLVDLWQSLQEKD
jgi:hypothetical protein